MEIVPPTVDGTPSVSGAGTDAQWSVGETVGVTVTFSEAVDVDTSGGTPSIGIGLGGTAARSATYASGTGTTELVFEYTLVSGDGSHGYMAVTPDSLALNGGTIRSAGSGVDALLAHNGALTSGNSGRSTGPEVRFEDVPTGHDGATAFTVALRFGGVPEGLTQATVEGALLEVTGGRVTAARQTAEGANPAWEVTVAPDGPGEVTLRLPVRACTEANAVCIGGRALAEAVEAAVPGVPLTASFTQAPAAHDGSNGFDLHMEFSHEPNSFSYRTVRDALFDVAGGRIGRVWRREPGNNRLWGITVVPDGRRRGDPCRARGDRVRRAARRVRRGRAEVLRRLAPDGARTADAFRGVHRAGGDAGERGHGGGVHALAHGRDGCRTDGGGGGL